jgi:hypothetical protein
MTFAEHITTNVFLPRLNDRRILVVYDENKRFVIGVRCGVEIKG